MTDHCALIHLTVPTRSAPDWETGVWVISACTRDTPTDRAQLLDDLAAVRDYLAARSARRHASAPERAPDDADFSVLVPGGLSEMLILSVDGHDFAPGDLIASVSRLDIVGALAACGIGTSASLGTASATLHAATQRGFAMERLSARRAQPSDTDTSD